ncbi:MAG: 30S ribosomal protein S20 [Alphaproteobacteria bacterium]|nr:30S ribosomal protein S20 [Alphaproteobacteria bacterium]
MANIKSAAKQARKAVRNAATNKARMSRIRTYVKKVEAAIESGDKNAAQSALKAAQPELHRGAGKGYLHRNTVARKLSRLSARVKAL